MALFECTECRAVLPSPRRYLLHTGPACRCPLCGTYRVTRLREPDRIDPPLGGFLNLLERLAGGRLHHCRYCRKQFWDRRPLYSEISTDEIDPQTGHLVVTIPPDRARSDG
jgi:hypothetical protein